MIINRFFYKVDMVDLLANTRSIFTYFSARRYIGFTGQWLFAILDFCFLFTYILLLINFTNVICRGFFPGTNQRNAVPFKAFSTSLKTVTPLSANPLNSPHDILSSSKRIIMATFCLNLTQSQLIKQEIQIILFPLGPVGLCGVWV